MSSYILFCSVCENSFKSKAEWDTHLLESYHQSKARIECCNWTKKVRKCAILVFSSFPVTRTKIGKRQRGHDAGGGKKLISYFSSGDEGRLVTDFVWWESRPNVAVVQFESLVKVKQVLSNGEEVMIDNQRVQMKWGKAYLQMEWKLLIPSVMIVDTTEIAELDVALATTTSQKATKRRKLSDSCQVTESEAVAKTGASKDFPYSNQFESNPSNLVSDHQVSSTTAVTASATINSSDPTEIFDMSLKSQFQRIRKRVEIPEDKLQSAKDIMSRVKQVFNTKYENIEVALLRHWYLGLRNHSSDELLIYIYSKSSYDLVMYPEYIKNCILYSGRNLFAGSSYVDEDVETAKSSGFGGPQFTDRKTGLNFHILTYKFYIVEVQMARLLQYLCTFDPRCQPLLTLVHYWAIENHCKLGNSPGNPRHAFKRTPDPSALEWLVIFFMVRLNLIPSPRKIMKRSHEPLLLPESEFSCGRVDIGFEADPKFAAKWVRKNKKAGLLPSDESSEAFFLSVFQLAKDFFRFGFSILPPKPSWFGTPKQLESRWVLNMKDAEIIAIKDLFFREEGVLLETKLTKRELKSIMTIKRSEDNPSKYLIDPKHWLIYIIHPLVVSWMLCVSNKQEVIRTCRIMGKTAEALEKYLSEAENATVTSENEQVNLENVFEVKEFDD